MAVKITGVLAVEEMIFRIETTARKRVTKVIVKKAEQIRDLAKKMAPVDFGGLEESIKVRQEGGGRDELGRFAAVNVDVYIDMDAPGGDPKRPEVVVGDYAYEVHEHLEPAGAKRLGDKSMLKQATQTEIVGGGFMDRAADQIERDIDIALIESFEDLF